MAVDTVPAGFPTIPILATARGNELYAFLKQAFEAVLLDRRDAPNGEPSYMTLRMGDSVISVMQPHDGRPTRSAFYVYVTNVDAVYERAVKAGARSIQAPTDAVHGDRMATVVDELGNQWTIATSIERISVEELQRRLGERREG
jgi:PhnB protein